MEEENKKKPINVPKKRRRGRPTTKEAKVLRTAMSLVKHKLDKQAAYKELTGNNDDKNAMRNANRLLTEEVMEAVKQLLAIDQMIETNKSSIEKMLQLVIARYVTGKETGANYIAAIKLLSNLVPEFSEKHQITNIGEMDEKEIDKLIKEEFGLDPNSRN